MNPISNNTKSNPHQTALEGGHTAMVPSHSDHSPSPANSAQPFDAPTSPLTLTLLPPFSNQSSLTKKKPQQLDESSNRYQQSLKSNPIKATKSKTIPILDDKI